MLAGGRGFGTEPPVADTRSLEECFQTQLQQLQEMSFINASQNVRALLATGEMKSGEWLKCALSRLQKSLETLPVRIVEVVIGKDR